MAPAPATRPGPRKAYQLLQLNLGASINSPGFHRGIFLEPGWGATKPVWGEAPPAPLGLSGAGRSSNVWLLSLVMGSRRPHSPSVSRSAQGSPGPPPLPRSSGGLLPYSVLSQGPADQTVPSKVNPVTHRLQQGKILGTSQRRFRDVWSDLVRRESINTACPASLTESWGNRGTSVDDDQPALCLAISSRTSGTRSTGTSMAV